MFPFVSCGLFELKKAPKNGIVGAARSTLEPAVGRVLRAEVEWGRSRVAG
jgi:hypothetical protein